MTCDSSPSLRSFPRPGVVPPAISLSNLDLSPFLRRFAHLGSPVFLTKCHLGLTVFVPDSLHPDALVFLRSFSWLDAGLLIWDSVNPGALPPARRPVHLDASMLLTSALRLATLAPALGMSSPGSFLPLRGPSQVGPLTFACSFCRSEVLLPTPDCSFVESLLLLHRCRSFEALLLPVGFYRPGVSVFVYSSLLGLLLPLQNLSHPDLLLPVLKGLQCEMLLPVLDFAGLALPLPPKSLL